MNNLIKAFIKPRKLLAWVWVQSSKFIKSDELYLKVYFRLYAKERLDLNTPETFNQKIQWLKLHNRGDFLGKMVDKYEVLNIVREKIGDEYLVPLLGVWESPDQIDFDHLPDQFVLKPTHDSQSTIICKNKADFNINKARLSLSHALKYNYYLKGREMPYRHIRPRIIAQKYLEEESGTGLKDYKFFCFNGRVGYIQVDTGRFTDHRRNMYDRDWNLQEFEFQRKKESTKIIEKPTALKVMIGIAEELSKGFCFVRIDLYLVKDRIYFGEYTFHPDGGIGRFKPKEWNKKLGDMIELNF